MCAAVCRGADSRAAGDRPVQSGRQTGQRRRLPGGQAGQGPDRRRDLRHRPAPVSVSTQAACAPLLGSRISVRGDPAGALLLGSVSPERRGRAADPGGDHRPLPAGAGRRAAGVAGLVHALQYPDRSEFQPSGRVGSDDARDHARLDLHRRRHEGHRGSGGGADRRTSAPVSSAGDGRWLARIGTHGRIGPCAVVRAWRPRTSPARSPC